MNSGYAAIFLLLLRFHRCIPLPLFALLYLFFPSFPFWVLFIYFLLLCLFFPPFAFITQPDVGPTKQNSAKSRPSTLSTNDVANSAKRPSPTAANKKSPVPKATTPTAAKRQPITGSTKAAKVSSSPLCHI